MAAVVIAYELIQLFIVNKKLNLDFSVSSKKLDSLKTDNVILRADLEYFKNPENFEKELRSRLNYKKPGEKMIIVVPPKNSQ